MASHLSTSSRATVRPTFMPFRKNKQQLTALTQSTLPVKRSRLKIVKVSNGGGDSYLDMWKKAVDREREEIEFRKIVENSERIDEEESEIDREALERKSSEFKKILEVSKEERDRIQRMQVIDRAAAAIAAARAIVNEGDVRNKEGESDGRMKVQREGNTGCI